MAAPVHHLPVFGVHSPDCCCKVCLMAAVREVVEEVVAARMPAAPEQALDVAAAAKSSGLSEWSIRALVAAGDLRHLRVGKRVLVLRSDLEEWMHRRVEEPLPVIPQAVRS